MHFPYGEKEVAYLAAKDQKLGAAMEQIGHIHHATDPDLFSSVVRHIVGQQISMAAQAAIWRRTREALGEVTAETICQSGAAELQRLGMSFRKATYIENFAQKVRSGAFDVDSLREKSDAEVIAALSALQGIGVWTAEMLMTFSLMRPDVVSFGDLAIHRGMRMLYHHRNIDRVKFERYRRRYSPYGTVASLYLWAIANGTIADMKDYAPKKKSVKG